MPEITDARQIQDLAKAFQQSRVLLTAVELNVFTVLGLEGLFGCLTLLGNGRTILHRCQCVVKLFQPRSASATVSSEKSTGLR